MLQLREGERQSTAIDSNAFAACAALCCAAAVDFSLISDEEDVLWQAEHREQRGEIQARGRLFLEQLMARPETHIAVSPYRVLLGLLLLLLMVVLRHMHVMTGDVWC
jgi:hypothetical protein